MSAGSSDPFRVLFIKRSAKSKFMPSRHVFPGGVVERADRFSPSLPPLPRTGLIDTPLRLAERDFRQGAIRELFEEAGLLLASKHPQQNGYCPVANVPGMEEARDTVGGARWPRVLCLVMLNPACVAADWQVHKDAWSFADFCRKHQLQIADDCLVPWGRWYATQ